LKPALSRARLGLVSAAVALVLASAGTARASGDESAQAPHGAAHAEGEHVPHWGQINWYKGMIGEKAGVPANLFWRPPGMPVPFAAQVFNFTLLFGAAYVFGKNRVRAALTKRKATILHGIEEASKMRDSAGARLAAYEDRLEHIDSEVERVTGQMREAGVAERARILSEAGEKRERLKREAETLIEHELKATREHLYRETVRAAMLSAQQVLTQTVTIADQQRVAREYMDTLQATASQLRGKV
jgi:F0F1-type ATP synthase membrane subunit b/b'